MPTFAKSHDISVIVYDRALQKAVPKSSNIKIIKFTEQADIEAATNLFVLSSDVGLKAASQVIHKANRQNRLRALMIHTAADATWLPQFMNRADVRTLRNTIVHSGMQVPKRVLRAWAEGSQDMVIARATVDGDILLIQDCAAQIHEFPFASNRATAKLSPSERSSFEVDPDGNYIIWPQADIHLDMETIRNTIDPEFTRQAATERIVHDKTFGRAVSIFRESSRLRQSDIPGLSTRQVGRIEHGDRATIKAIRQFAQAHKMDVNAYLNEIAKVMGEIRQSTA